MASDFPEYKEIPHTADLQIIAFGRSLEELFTNAAKGMYAAAGAEVGEVDGSIKNMVLTGNDPETLLVDFLEELLFMAEEGWMMVAPKINITLPNLLGEIPLYSLKNMRIEIKAVTYHEMKISHQDGIYQTKITFDI